MLCRLKPTSPFLLLLFFFFNDTATTEIYTLSLHDALPISGRTRRQRLFDGVRFTGGFTGRGAGSGNIDRKSTRLNSSHLVISYAVFCLKKKKAELIGQALAPDLDPLVDLPVRHPVYDGLDC